MNNVVQQHYSKTRKTIYNYHLWAITFIMIVLGVFYNADSIGFDIWFPGLERAFDVYLIHDMHRSLFLIPLLYAGVVFKLWGVAFTWLAFLVAVLPRALYISPHLYSLERTMLFALVALLAGVLVALEEKWRQAERKSYNKLEIVRQIYLSEVMKAQENERQRIAQELHDDTVQSLLVIANTSNNLANGDYGSLEEEAERCARNISNSVLDVTENLRRLSRDLRPNILDSMGLLPAIRWLVERLNDESKIRTKVELNGAERKLNSGAEVVIFRIVQEAISNIRRHSGATEAVITLDFSPENLKVSIQDNGNGFLLPEIIGDFTAEGKLGLNGMHERAKLINADLHVESGLGKGTIITIEAKV